MCVLMCDVVRCAGCSQQLGGCCSTRCHHALRAKARLLEALAELEKAKQDEMACAGSSRRLISSSLPCPHARQGSNEEMAARGARQGVRSARGRSEGVHGSQLAEVRVVEADEAYGVLMREVWEEREREQQALRERDEGRRRKAREVEASRIGG
jgi:hypothetical protein